VCGAEHKALAGTKQAGCSGAQRKSSRKGQEEDPAKHAHILWNLL